MNKKLGVVIVLIAMAIIAVFCVKHYKVKNSEVKQEAVPTVIKSQADNPIQVKSSTKPPVDKTVKADLYKSITDNALSLASITELSNLPDEVKQFVSEILGNSNNIYLIKKTGNNVIIVYDNPENYRHGLDVTQISLDNGEISTTLFTENSDDEQEEWEYEEQGEYEKRPVKHIKYNTDGEIIYTEIWNNNPNAEIKYEKTDVQGRPISINKEIIDDNGGMRQEHLIYDKDGNTEVNVSTSFEGANLVRFTYYDIKNPDNGASVFNEYSENGEKTKETVYTSDLKHKNTYIPDLRNGERTGITVYDNENKVINKFIAK